MSEVIITIAEAKKKFSEIMRDVRENCITYVVMKNGTPCAKISPFESNFVDEIAEEIKQFLDEQSLDLIDERVAS